MLQVGIVGLPNVGKSTLFNALTQRTVPASHFPFCTIEPNKAIVSLPDTRLTRLAEATDCPKLMPSMIEFVDIAGLVRGAHKGVGLGNEFLTHIRGVDLVLHVVRAFVREDVPHVEERIDPVADLRIIEEELVRADFALIDKHRIAQKSRMRNTAEKNAPLLFAALDTLWRALREEGKTVRDVPLSSDELDQLRPFDFLTLKPSLVVVNVGEDGPFEAAHWSERFGRPAVPLCVSFEQEIGELAPDERVEYRESLGVPGGVDAVVHACYDALGLITFYTFGKGVTRAWPIKVGTTALEAAGMIHTDFLQTFIKAQVFSLDALQAQGERVLRERGHFETVGRDYKVQDGDVLWFVTR